MNPRSRKSIAAFYGALSVSTPASRSLCASPVLRAGGGHRVFGFCDAHIETLTTKAFTDYHDLEVLRYWNRDDLPHP